jgi:lysophospholipase L1-like esterase
MKRMILALSLLLMACSQGTSPTAPTIVVTERPQQTLPPTEAVEEGSSIPATDVLSTDNPPVDTLPPGPVTIVALGDSLTQGDGDDTGRGYPARLLDLVNAVRPGSTMTNLGQSGWNSDALINGDQGLAGQLPRAVEEIEAAAAEGRAAVALVWIGSNDLWYAYEFNEGSDENDALDAEHFAANMDVILGQLRAAGAQVIVALLDDQTRRPVALKGEAFPSITADELDRMSQQVQRYNEMIAEKAAHHGALTVDFYSTDIFTNPATLYDDGNHPNAAGYDVIAQKWFEALRLLFQ